MTTHRLVRDSVDADAVEPLELKGKDERVPAWRLLGVRDVVSAPRNLDSPMVGRERQLSQLGQAFEAAVEDASCQLFTLLGSAGVGKSRLVEEFISGAAGTGDHPARSLPALRRGHHVLPGRRGDQAGGRAGGLRHARRRRGEGVLGPRRRRAPRARLPSRVATDGRGRVGRGRGNVLGDPPVLRGSGARTPARARVRRHPLGRAHVPGPRRAHRRLVARLADPAAVHGAFRPARRPAGVGWREAERGDRVARTAHRGTGRGARRELPRLGRAAGRARRADRREGRRESAVRGGDARDVDRRRTHHPRGRRVARDRRSVRRHRSSFDPRAARRSPGSPHARGAHGARGGGGHREGLLRRRRAGSRARGRPPAGALGSDVARSQGADPPRAIDACRARTRSASATC